MKQLIAIIVLVLGAIIAATVIPPEARYIFGYTIGTIVTLVLCLTDED